MEHQTHEQHGAAPDGAVPEPPATGDPAVDAAVRELALAAAGPLEAQLTGFEETHKVLQDRLADVEG